MARRTVPKKLVIRYACDTAGPIDGVLRVWRYRGEEPKGALFFYSVGRGRYRGRYWTDRKLATTPKRALAVAQAEAAAELARAEAALAEARARVAKLAWRGLVLDVHSVK